MILLYFSRLTLCQALLHLTTVQKQFLPGFKSHLIFILCTFSVGGVWCQVFNLYSKNFTFLAKSTQVTFVISIFTMKLHFFDAKKQNWEIDYLQFMDLCPNQSIFMVNIDWSLWGETIKSLTYQTIYIQL